MLRNGVRTGPIGYAVNQAAPRVVNRGAAKRGRCGRTGPIGKSWYGTAPRVRKRGCDTAANLLLLPPPSPPPPRVLALLDASSATTAPAEWRRRRRRIRSPSMPKYTPSSTEACQHAKPRNHFREAAWGATAGKTSGGWGIELFEAVFLFSTCEIVRSVQHGQRRGTGQHGRATGGHLRDRVRIRTFRLKPRNKLLKLRSIVEQHMLHLIQLGQGAGGGQHERFGVQNQTAWARAATDDDAREC